MKTYIRGLWAQMLFLFALLCSLNLQLLTVHAQGSKPIITAPPTNQFVNFGTPTSLSASVSSALPVTYQWQENGTNVVGATNLILNLDDTTLTNGGSYTLIAENASGGVTSSVAKVTLLLPAYSAVDLGTLGGLTNITTYGINNNGQVVGEADSSGTATAHAFLYSGGTMADLGTLNGGLYSVATGINDNGQVVGHAYNTGDAASHAFRYSGGTMTDLGTLGGRYSYASGINNNGQVVGESGTSGISTINAFLSSGGSMSDLGTLNGVSPSTSYTSTAYGINNSGQVVGSSSGGGEIHAFLYSGGTMSDLGTLGGSNSVAYGINTNGQIVGYAETIGNAANHAFLYSGGTMSDLGARGGVASFAYGINNNGHVVGYVATGGNAHHAFLYNGTAMGDLNSLLKTYIGTSLQEARGINDSDQITANGANHHAYLLTLLPAPASTNWLAYVQPKFQSTALVSGHSVTFSWNPLPASPSVSYQVQYNTNLISTNWINLGSLRTITSYTDAPASQQRSYRVQLVQ